MTYVFISYNYSPGFDTAENWLKRTAAYVGLLECLSKTDTVINIKQIDFTGNYVHSGVQHHFVNFNREKTFFPHKLHAYVKRLNPDVVVIHGTHLPLQVLQLRILLNRRTKIIIQHHAEQPFNGIKKHAQRLADRYVDAYFFAAKNMGLDWVKRGNLASPQKIHEAMEVSSVFAPINRACALSKSGINGEPVFLWVGRLDKNKDPLTVVSAFLNYLKIRPTARLYMIYPNDELLPDIKKLLAAWPAYKNNIVLVGKLPHTELLYWYNSADFIISGSHYEGSGTAVCEAMSCGCIPIVTAIEALKMVTDNGRCGMLYEAGNTQALFESLINIRNINIEQKREITLAYYRSTLSFEAIAGRFSAVAEGLST